MAGVMPTPYLLHDSFGQSETGPVVYYSHSSPVVYTTVTNKSLLFYELTSVTAIDCYFHELCVLDYFQTVLLFTVLVRSPYQLPAEL